ncbi:D-alanine--D-alanine ligase [Leucobacter sp. NPDC015123]|uniref:D-alanine--D-alanine ligase family protein n=1 Tax=Leucobacter sp. NPDC015123 TaxID=3364129 RepID=UPI0036F496B2
MSRARHVLVVGGGANAEHDVSIGSAAAVREALLASGHLVTGLTIRRDGGWETVSGTQIGIAAAIQRLRESDVIFPALHGEGTEDGTIAGLLDVIGVPYVGSGVRAGALAMDKWTSKLIAERLGISTARGALVDGESTHGDPAGVPLPVVVKPVASGSSYGAARVDRAQDLDAAIAAAQQYDTRVLVEEFVTAREIDVAVMRGATGELHVAPPLEIGKDTEQLFDTALKYDAAPDFRVPAAVPQVVRDRLSAAAKAMYEALGCAGVARVDFFVRDDEIIFNEINTMPGMTEHSQVPRMFAVDGVTFPELTARLVAAAYARDARRSEKRDAEDSRRRRQP